MPKPNRNDICIGQDKWITFIELDDQQTNVIELDEILKPVESFLELLETDCLAACCGIDAYALWPNDIKHAARQSEIKNLSISIDDARQRIAASIGDTFVSHRMNNYFHRQTLLQLIDHIAHCVRQAEDPGEYDDKCEPKSP